MQSVLENGTKKAPHSLRLGSIQFPWSVSFKCLWKLKSRIYSQNLEMKQLLKSYIEIMCLIGSNAKL